MHHFLLNRTVYPLFFPQLTQWRQFEEDVNPQPSHMAKYFSSKSLRSSENDIYYLLGEYDSMKRLISEVRARLSLLTYCITVLRYHLQQGGSAIHAKTTLNLHLVLIFLMVLNAVINNMRDTLCSSTFSGLLTRGSLKNIL